MNRKPLVLSAGTIQQIPAGDQLDPATLPASSGGAIMATVEVNCQSYYTEAVVINASVTASSKINAAMSMDSTTGRDGDEAEMEPANVFVKDIVSGQFTLVALAQEGPFDGPYKFNYMIG
jgi:hypothetical protein